MRSTRGFTLIELLVVVAMIGILAGIAAISYRRLSSSAQASEASAMISGIRAAEEAYRSEAYTYLGCSGCGASGCAAGAGNLTTFYPNTSPAKTKMNWNNPSHADYACWRLLNVTSDGPVEFGYAVVAGNPNMDLPSLAGFMTSPPAWPAEAKANVWYVIHATRDRDGNNKFANIVGTSLSGELLIDNDWE